MLPGYRGTCIFRLVMADFESVLCPVLQLQIAVVLGLEVNGQAVFAGSFDDVRHVAEMVQ